MHHFLNPPDITCLHLPTWDGVMVSSGNVYVGAEVNITCEEEYVFDDNSSTLLSCLENGTWYPAYPKCKCELSWLNITGKYTLVGLNEDMILQKSKILSLFWIYIYMFIYGYIDGLLHYTSNVWSDIYSIVVVGAFKGCRVKDSAHLQRGPI